MKVTDEMVQAACNAYDDHLKEHNNVLLRSVATGHGMRAALEAAMKTLWVSISNKLPPSFVQVLALDSQEGRHIVIYMEEYNQWFSADNNHLYNVTHWMPIPEYNSNH